ncbi:methyltransferase family protein [Saccharolobus caldissimus]|uniref:Isoprenylcysteine carboxyl methyltransferase n=1 Tax=Saccharolobus caldissimus TaxID=1702097 RepID=A0AAQ4CR28_9CREN|nr:isoprenylcysteine carboxylmethyltransferase family protein [Saccharolobus caldissimus]BDB98259.1 isoprenylcysteine carboxyl methyltransferase [Saccharolobus caldissimus]
MNIFGTILNEFIFYGVLYGWFILEFINAYLIPFLRNRRRKIRNKEWKSFGVFLVTMYFSFFISYFFAFFSFYTRIGELPLIVFYLGIVIMISGIFFRYWAVYTLGKYFSPIVTIYSDHKIVKSGPYRFVRHPAYGGALIAILGMGISLRSVLSAIIPFIIMLIVVNYRANLEERLLTAEVGNEYLEYKRTVKRKFIPFII